MKKTWLLLAGIALLGLGAIVMVNSHSSTPKVPAHDHQVAQTPVEPAAPMDEADERARAEMRQLEEQAKKDVAEGLRQADDDK